MTGLQIKRVSIHSVAAPHMDGMCRAVLFGGPQ